jgi:uridine kinase
MVFEDLARTIQGLNARSRQKLVAIDGGGGAGKSTFADRLAEQLPGSVIIHTDDFYIGPWDRRLDHTDHEVNPLFDWDRFAAQVIAPVRAGEPIAYQVYDWHAHALSEQPLVVPTDALVIVEGLFCTQSRFRDVYDFRVWIELDEATRLERAMIRDGEHMRFLWEEDWLPVERNYLSRQRPRTAADLVVDGRDSQRMA